MLNYTILTYIIRSVLYYMLVYIIIWVSVEGSGSYTRLLETIPFASTPLECQCTCAAAVVGQAYKKLLSETRSIHLPTSQQETSFQIGRSSSKVLRTTCALPCEDHRNIYLVMELCAGQPSMYIYIYIYIHMYIHI